MNRAQGFVFATLIATCVGCDHATKQVARSVLGEAGPLSVAVGLVKLELVLNPGAFLSLGAGLSPEVRHILLLITAPLLLGLLSLILLRSGALDRRQVAGIALFTGGGLANWLDRMLHDGAVTDFVSLGVGSLRTGIFNLADVVIVLGFLMLLISAPRGQPAPPGVDA